MVGTGITAELEASSAKTLVAVSGEELIATLVDDSLALKLVVAPELLTTVVRTVTVAELVTAFARMLVLTIDTSSELLIIVVASTVLEKASVTTTLGLLTEVLSSASHEHVNFKSVQ